MYTHINPLYLIDYFLLFESIREHAYLFMEVVIVFDILLPTGRRSSLAAGRARVPAAPVGRHFKSNKKN